MKWNGQIYRFKVFIMLSSSIDIIFINKTSLVWPEVLSRKEISNKIFIRRRKRALGDKNTFYQDQKQRSNLI